MRRRHLRRSLRQILSSEVWRTRLAFWCGALVVGAAATALALAADWSARAFARIAELIPYAPLILSPLGFAAVAYFTQRFFPEARGSGIPQAIAALSLRDDVLRGRMLSLRVAAGKMALIVLGLLSGGSIGREGPTVHVAASVMYSLRRLARFPHHDIGRGLILAGGAAGIASAFNTPLAGIVFAIEEMSRSFESRTSGTVLTAVIIAGLAALAILGNYRYFGTLQVDAHMGAMWIPVLACGIVGGLLGGVFSSLLLWGGRRLSVALRRYPVKVAASCGLAVAVIGLASNFTTFGTGYEQARLILTETGEPDAAYPYMKMLATLASYWSGIPGGIFAPSLSIGTGIGANLAPLFSTPTPVVAMLGMVAYFSGVVQTPITAVVIVVEMTDSQPWLLPLMATALIANAVSRLVCPKPLYRALAEDFQRDAALR